MERERKGVTSHRSSPAAGCSGEGRSPTPPLSLQPQQGEAPTWKPTCSHHWDVWDRGGRGSTRSWGGPGRLSVLGIRSAALNHQLILRYWFLVCLSVLIKVKNNNTAPHAGTLLTTPQLPLDHRFPGCWG